MMYVHQLTALLLLLPPVHAAYEYAAVCIPLYSTSDAPECFVTILSNTTATVEITTIEESIVVDLDPGIVYERAFYNFNPDDVYEYKGIKITSSEELQVVMYKGTSWDNDVYTIPSLQADSNSFFTTAYISADTPCNSYEFKEFYLVTGYYNETFVNVIQQDGVSHELELSEYGTFLQRTQGQNDHLASGTRITSSKPITVISGNLCINNYISGSIGGYASNIPSVGSIGNHYVLSKIISSNENPAGFSVSVVATEDNTWVESDGEVRFLNEGQSAIFEYEYMDRSIIVNCSENCLVAQYSKTWSFYLYGLFMLHGLPEHQFYTSAYFSALEVLPPTYLSLVVTGEAPGDDLYLNGVSLGGLTWTPLDGYTTTQLSIAPGPQQLISVDGRPFAVFVYGHANFDRGVGYTLLSSSLPPETTVPPYEPETTEPPYEPMTTEQPDPSPTGTMEPPDEPETTEPPYDTTTPEPSVTPPPINATYPQHTARVNGTAYTTDGLELTPQCAVAHLNNLEDKTKDMMMEVNDAIGQTICMNIRDILVVSGKAATFNQGSQTLMEMDHTLRVLGHHVMNDVVACAAQVAKHLSDHSNWWTPIFPVVPGCSRLEVDPEYFNMSATFWTCDNQMDEGPISTPLSYESVVSEVLETDDGSDLTQDCARSYSEEADEKAGFMMGEITKALSAFGCSDVVTETTHVHSLTVLRNQAYFSASFYYVSSGWARLDEFLWCVQQMHEFSLQHENWSPGSQPGDPWLPVPPGCPELHHDGPTLDDDGQKWICI